MNGSAAIAFVNGHVLDEQGKFQNASVIVADDRILSVGRGEPPDHATVIDLAGKALMPGMSVCHWHGEFLEIGPPRFGPPHAGICLGEEQPPAVLALIAARSLQGALLSGVTNIMSASCSHDLDWQLVEAMRLGLFVGPRLTPCSRHVLTTGDPEDRNNWWQRTGAANGIRRIGQNVFADGPAELAKAVRQEIHRGAMMIKVLPTGDHGVGVAPGYRGMSRQELELVVETAHDRGVRVRAHAATRRGILEAVAAGVDIIDHGDGMDDACLDAMVKAGSIWVPSMLFAQLISYGGEGLPRADNANDAAWDNMAMMLGKANAAGLTIVPGDDYGIQTMDHAPGVYGRELELYVKYGCVPASDVLRWATINGAKASLDDRDYGSIAPGKIADLVVIDGDPVQDIGLLTRPEQHLKAVMLGGRFVKNELAPAPANSDHVFRARHL
jgi:imidazolonepropionase-like amidohydrolase